MGRYIANRLWLSLPTIATILVLAFLLMQASPEDTTDRQLGLDGDNVHVSRLVYVKAYKTKATALGKLLPSFYFSFTPSYFPHNVNSIYPKRKKEIAIRLLRECHDWDKVNQALSDIGSSIDHFEKEKSARGIIRDLLKLEQSQSIHELQSRMNSLEISEELSTISTTKIKALQSSINNLSPSGAISYPKLRWHGTQNQFQFWLSKSFNSKLNISLIDGKSVWSKVGNALKWTFSMSLIALTLIGILSLIISYFQVLRKDSWWDQSISIILYLVYAMPLFWFCTLMVVFFTTKEYGAWTNIFPSVGIKPSFTDAGFFSRFISQFGQLILPILCIVVHSMAYLTRQTRRDMLEHLDKPYVTTAMAKGLSYPQILKRHVLPDALLPYTTLMTGAIPALFTGSVIVEVIFNIPGIGRLMLESVNNADWPVAMTILIIVSIATIIGFLIGDLILVRLYPQTAESLISKKLT